MLNEDSNMEELELTEAETDEEDHKLPQYALWVEKYTPRYFTELLSDDVSKINVLLLLLLHGVVCCCYCCCCYRCMVLLLLLLSPPLLLLLLHGMV